MEYYSAIKKTEIIPFAATWIEMIMLSEVNQIKQISQDTTYIWNLKNMIQMNLFTKQKQTYRHRKQTYGLRGACQVALVVKNLPVNAGDIRDAGLIPGSRRSPRGGHGNLLQYSWTEEPGGL